MKQQTYSLTIEQKIGECRLCYTITHFVASESPKGLWVCINCQHRCSEFEERSEEELRKFLYRETRENNLKKSYGWLNA